MGGVVVVPWCGYTDEPCGMVGMVCSIGMVSTWSTSELVVPWYGMVWYVAYEALTAVVVASLGCATEQTSGHCEHPGAPNGTVSYGMVVVVPYHTIVT